jgi:transglutaminase-like putative cysteine protease
VVYDEDDRIDLAPLIAMQNPGDLPVLRTWLDLNFGNRPNGSLRLLRALGETIHGAFVYTPRDELGTQTAAATIGHGRGTCRDFAFLFMEAARSLGFAARFVTGYLHDPRTDDGALTGGGATHAWAEIYIPGRGWIGFDPTNRIVAAGELIRVATTRTPTQASPIIGSFSGDGASVLGMDVSVTVTAEPQDGGGAAQAAD